MLVFKKGSYNKDQLWALYSVMLTAFDDFLYENRCKNHNEIPLCEICENKTVCNDLQNLLVYLGKLTQQKS